MPSDQMKPILLDNNFDWEIPEREKWMSTSNPLPPVNSIACFTDGSKMDGLSGAGYYCESLNLSSSIHIDAYATVYQVELFAISELCGNEALKNCMNETLVICSDSQSAIEALGSFTVNSKLVHECKLRLNEIGSRNEVKLLWVPGHENIEENEKADELARRGTEKPQPKIGISRGTRKRLVK